jgi:hypothetical protein
VNTEPLGPRLLRAVGPPLGSYLRPGRNDHNAVLDFIGERPGAFTGVVLDPGLEIRQRELRTEAGQVGIETVLDTRGVELATEVGFERHAAGVPWAGESVHTPQHLTGSGGEELAAEIASYMAEKRFGAVLSPTHYLSESESEWTHIDSGLTRALRRELDEAGLRDVPIYYPLALHSSLFRDAAERARLITTLQALPIDALWLRVHPFASTSGPLALRRYIEACRDFHRLGLPLVAERTGTVGVALLAFGAVGGIEGGLTFGERYDVTPLLRKQTSGDPFLPPPRVYISEIGAYLTRKQADHFFENRSMKAAFGCRDTSCCRHGVADMLRDPRRHFMIQRTAEVGRLSRAPEGLRPQNYLDDFIRPATDLALKAARAEPSLEPTRKRLEGWRQTLAAMTRSGRVTSFAMVPEGRRMSQRKRA